MNYYIQGDADNADKISAAFEKLGYDTSMHLFNAKSVLYFTFDGDIRATTNGLFKTFIKSRSDYKELELPVKPKFKVGDWITNDTFTHYIVSIVDGFYYFYGGGYLDFGKIDGYYHLWTIEDAKDGDVLVSGIDNPFIYDGNIEFSSAGAYVGVSRNGRIRLDMFPSKAWTSIKDVKPATIEQRDLLFAKMREAGYEWDADKKELRKIRSHYDIANLHAGMPVLVRDYNNSQWSYVQFSHLIAERNVGEGGFKFNACGIPYIQCIPFEGNEHLLGTTDMPSEEFINW